MIKELELLLPLLQQAGEGAFWVAVLFIAKGVLGELLVTGTALTIAWLIARTVIKLNGKEHDGRPLHERMAIRRLNAAYEAVREAWLYGNLSSADSVKLHQMYEELQKLVRRKD